MSNKYPPMTEELKEEIIRIVNRGVNLDDFKNNPTAHHMIVNKRVNLYCDNLMTGKFQWSDIEARTETGDFNSPNYEAADFIIRVATGDYEK